MTPNLWGSHRPQTCILWSNELLVSVGVKIKKPLQKLIYRGFFILRSADLLSHILTNTLPSALRSLTTVFGMGTGVSPSV